MSAQDLLDDCKRDDLRRKPVYEAVDAILFMQKIILMMVFFIFVVLLIHDHREAPEPVIHCPPLHHVYDHIEDGVPHYFCVMDKRPREPK